jgi:tetratricopeptide (TPR) repeat protein
MPGYTDKAEIDSLTRELGYFPLALEQAGAFIHENQTSFDDYLKSFRKRRIAFLEQHVPVMGGYKETVATTWAINFAEVEKTPASADLLRLSAFLAPILIPFELLERGKAELGETLASKLEGVSDDPVLLGNILTPLTSYSLIRRNNATRSYSIHPLVQEVIRANMNAEVQRSWAGRTVNALSAAFPDPEEFKNWVTCERLLSHALLCAKHVTDYNLESAVAANLLRNTGYYLYDRGQLREAEPFLNSALKMREKICGPEHPDTADSLSKMALLKISQGRYSDARLLEQRALEVREKRLGAEHAETGTSVHNLAGISSRQGRYVEAETLYRRALAIKVKALGWEHRETALNLANLATFCEKQGRYSEAETLHKKALAIREKILGPEHPDTSSGLESLGAFYFALHRYAEAESLNKRALENFEKNFGPEHPRTASTLNSLGSIYHGQGRLQEAEPFFRRALVIRKKVLGPEHPETASSLYEMARLYVSDRRYEEAERLYQQALEIEEKTAAEHPNTAATLCGIGILYLKQRNYRQAEPFLLRALAIQSRILGSANPDTIHSLKSLASLYRQWGRVREAIKYERQLKQLQKRRVSKLTHLLRAPLLGV